MGGLFSDVLVFYVLKATRNWLKARGSGKWTLIKAVITADPTKAQGYGCSTAEFVYSYRFEGELYTGFHEEPFIVGSASDYIERFPKGHRLIVRVKPSEPDRSLFCDSDQSHLARKMAVN